jgi:ERG8-type phosphomevalonate kinase
LQDSIDQQVVNVPGKVLFFGGYSVLEIGHIALSLAVVDDKGYGVTAQAKKHDSDMLVSEQFGIKQEINAPELVKKNVAMSAFFLTNLYLRAKGIPSRHLVSLTNSPIFGIEHKSGLGSSAAAPVAVVKAIFSAEGLDTYAHTETIHKLAQYSSAAFTGKTGSGFDIATCSFGHSVIYNRFNPASIVLPSKFNDTAEVTAKLLASIEKPWPSLLVRPITLPPKYGIIFFNIEGGKTSTVSNVKMVAEWKSQHPEEYRELITRQNEYETEAISNLLQSDDASLRRLTNSAREIHRKLQTEVEKSSQNLDPIEPKPLTHLIDFAQGIEGVIAGRCPGAGGWDGVAFLVDNNRFDDQRIKEIVAKGREYHLTLTHLPLRLL